MAVRVIRQLIDDLDESEASKTVTFAYDGTVYEIDLSETHVKEFDALMAPYIENGRKQPRGSMNNPGRKAPASARPPAPVAATTLPPTYTRLGKEQNRAIRDWAKKHPELGDLPERGRIPKHVIEAFHAAH